MDDLNKALNHLFGFKVPIDDYDEFEKKVEEARKLKEYLDKVEILKDIPQIITPVKMTNYDRIKNMSVGEMAEFLVTLHYAMEYRHYNLDAREVNKNLTKEEKQKTDIWEEESKPLWKQWLLQEVSEDEMPDMRK